MSKMITIVGPTASGKSTLAMKLAQKHHGQIICADSRTIYKGMDIGTAKPSKSDRDRVKHYLLDIVEPDEAYSAAEFKLAAKKAIQQIRRDEHVPFLVGGSGMYIDSVLFDYKFRSQDAGLSGGRTDEELKSLAKKLYPADFNRLDTSNRRRIEQLLDRGSTSSADRSTQKVDSLVIGLVIEKLTLKQNITNRTNQILSNGFVQEVQQLLKEYGPGAAGLQSTGYASVLRFLSDKISFDDMSQEIIGDTLKLAKKQMTWFKRNPDISWIGSESEADSLVTQYLQA